MKLFRTATRTRSNRMILAALCFAAIPLGATSTAQAAPSSVSISFGINSRHCHEPRVIRLVEPPCDNYAERERERGFMAGRDAGFDAGYRDGTRGHCFSDRPTASFCRVTNFFESGYRSGFTRAYADGYARGKAERHRCPPRCR